MAKQIILNEKEMQIVLDLIDCEHSILKPASIKLENKIRKIINAKPIKVSSRKAKGRNLQKWAVEKIAKLLDYELPENKDESHIRSREMGQPGVDVVLSKKAKQRFPFAVECKAHEKINLSEFMKQAKANCNEFLSPLLIVKNKTLSEPLLIMEWNTFGQLYHGWNIIKDFSLE